MFLQVIAKFETNLSASITAGDSTAVLNSVMTGDGVEVPEDTYGAIIDEENGSQEYVICSISGSNVTFLRRGISFIDGQTEIPALKKAHRKGASFKIVNHPALRLILNLFSSLNDDPEDVSSQCTGSNIVFTTTKDINVLFYISQNGGLLIKGKDFTVTGLRQITLSIPAPLAGETLHIKYL